MTWNIRDTIPRTPQGKGRKKRMGGATSEPIEAFQGNEAIQDAMAGVPPPALTDESFVLPTFVDMRDDTWEASDYVPPEVERELNTMGMITDRQWNAWARLCRRGLYEI